VTLPPVPLQEQLDAVLFLEGDLVSWSLAINERGGHKNLCGLNRRSVISYIHERTELYCSRLSCLCEHESYLFPALGRPLSGPISRPTSVKGRLSEPFITQGRTVTISLETRQMVSGQINPYVVGHG
jgi:hypothetical protein